MTSGAEKAVRIAVKTPANLSLLQTEAANPAGNISKRPQIRGNILMEYMSSLTDVANFIASVFNG